ncbi:MAG: hypothetical protein KDA45_00620 [Planctomycetales bacterium]|nr:hypothetical protein [Planctomycetales bacterium]
MATTTRPTATIDDALELVVTHFRGMTDSDGEPYVMHCLRVMMGVQGSQAQQIAVMHDLVEDTEITLAELRRRGFAEEVVQAVDLVTHKPQDSYAEYVVRLKGNALARQVKLSDLQDNSALNRVLYRSDRLQRDLQRIQRYLLSHQFLMDRIDEDHYRARMKEMEEG